ncbi:Thermoascus Gh61 isozyme A [Stachybotrys elegans]|uniref:lytic cellulose monooxygenase (C4-dehydrogenating) n=1 Tax=Stachybotrys elegans TaxID=80388 RepID=A0A8K0WJC8_9HYPO|nr:Thermoascus Gh61 isozyme A [Stachybotrys elegans]
MVGSKALVALLLAVSGATAHGFVKSITVGGISYPGFDPTIHPGLPQPPAVAGWTTNATDLGFVEPNNAGTPDIICHKQGSPGQASIDIRAGETLTIHWNSWPFSHKGPILDYLALCNGNCSTVDKSSLRFFKIAATALIRQNNAFGYWASDQLIDNNFAWQVTIPANLLPGNYVLRHEIISLLTAYAPNGAQLHPQCINLRVSGPGYSIPRGTAGTSMYRANDPGIIFALNFYVDPYPIPGPPLAVT